MNAQVPIAYVSDENYVALVDVAVEFERDGKCVGVARSSATGAIYLDLPPGEYRVTLAKSGFGSKRSNAMIEAGKPFHFRLLSDAMYGYAFPKWNRGGESTEFRVHSPTTYQLTLWRYGQTKELVRNIGCFDEHGPRANVQVLPDGDFTRTRADFNGQGFNANFSTAAPERSGLYYFHAVTPDGGFLSFPWVVAPAKPQAKIAVLMSTNTWNAYNNFGGRSNYINPTGLPPTPTVNARQDLDRYARDNTRVWFPPDDQYPPLSFDRPEPFNHIRIETQLDDPIRGRQACHLAETEWRLLGWLEREGFDYDVYSDYQLHDGMLDLDAYRVLILSTHPEYWSRQMYERAKAWTFERGGRLMYLGGNGIDCEVEFSDAATMRCKTFLPVPAGVAYVDPATNKRYDCRFHRTVESPAELLGVVFTGTGAGTSAPYRVADASHWIFADTGLKNGDVFGAASLHERCPGGASGHETDKRSPASPSNAKPLARGLNIDDGGAEIVCFDTPGGGEIFSAGSITWPASILVDKHVATITRNVIKCFLRD